MKNLAVTFQQRRSADGHPFTEILYGWDDDVTKEPRNACSRVWYALNATPHALAAEAQSFRKRRAEFEQWKAES